MNISGEIHVHKTETPIAELPVLEEVSGDEKLKVYDNGVAKSATVDTLLASAKSGQGLTEEIKTALLTIAEKAGYSDTHGRDYYDALYNALYPPAVLVAITANFAQGGNVVYDTDSLDSLKQYLAVTALYDTGTTQTVTGYTLSGTLTEGTSTVTVSYNGKTTTFNVIVTHRAVSVTGITAAFTQGSHVIYDNDALDVLRQYLVVTANYDDSTSAEVTSYTLSGSLTEGTSTITVSFGGFTDAFGVTVTAHPAVLTSISAAFTQGDNAVYEGDSLDTLKRYLVVTAHYDDSTTATVDAANYTLSGTLSEGTSTVTVNYGGKTTTFSVTVAHGTSPVITDTGVYFDESGTLLQSNNWCVSDYYEFPYKGSLPFTFVINAGADNNPGATAYLITYDSTNAKTNSYLTSIKGEKELVWRTVAPYAKFRASLCTKNGAPYYAYIKETGEVVFAGIDSPYYGMSNISEANQS